MNDRVAQAGLSKPESKGPMPSAPQRDLRLNFLIHDVSRMQMRVFDSFMEPIGVTRGQWLVVTFLSRRDGMTQTALAQMLDMTRANLGALLDKLEESGLITRVQHPVDRRAKCVFLTVKGNKLIERIRDTQHSYADIVLHGLTDAERDTLLGLLGRIKKAIRAIDLPLPQREQD